MTPDDFAAILARHTRLLPADKSGGAIFNAAFDVCSEDNEIWPCETMRGPAPLLLDLWRAADRWSHLDDMTLPTNRAEAAAQNDMAAALAALEAADV